MKETLEKLREAENEGMASDSIDTDTTSFRQMLGLQAHNPSSDNISISRGTSRGSMPRNAIDTFFDVSGDGQ
jgi:hypothetical protein